LKFIDEIKVNILYHLNKKKVKSKKPEILIIINETISLIGVIKLIHEVKSEDDLCDRVVWLIFHVTMTHQ